jgi:hypothetical protein
MPLPIKEYGVANLTFPRPAWRYFLLFQSWSQLQSWGIFVIATNVLINFLLSFLESRVLPVEGVLLGTGLGSLCSVVMVLPTGLVVGVFSSQRSNFMTAELEKLGYVLEDSQAGITIYRQKLPKVFRWNEGRVTIKRVDDCLTLEGPLMILKKIRHSLLRRIDV